MILIQIYIISYIFSMDDSEYDLRLQIRELLSKHSKFSEKQFDPAPFIIQILKEKDSNQEGMIKKQDQLIQLENQSQELIDEICLDYYEDLTKLLQLPNLYGEQLEKLKNNMSLVKKKVKETKSLLQNTQKDIQQIYLNCLFNKLIYRKLKEIEQKIHQYEAASLALKNNKFLDCAINLPVQEGSTILESTLSSRSETLRLRMISRAIEQINIFIYFSPKVVTPSPNLMIERVKKDETQLITNWKEHEGFYKRYKLFKKAECLQYLSKIWKFDDLDRKQGRIAMIHDIIKGAISIGKLPEVTNSIKLNVNKLINNLFILLKCFYINDSTPEMQNSQRKWFLEKGKFMNEFSTLISNVLCICGAMLRKSVIVRKICAEFEIIDDGLQSSLFLKAILNQISNLISIISFPTLQIQTTDNAVETGHQNLHMNLKQKLSAQKNYILYGCVQNMLFRALKLIYKNLKEIEENSFKRETKQQFQEIEKTFQPFRNQFYQYFHRDICYTLEQIFHREGRSFIIQAFDSIVEEKKFNNDEVYFMKSYRSDDKKAIKQYMLLVSFLKSMEQFFIAYKLENQKFLKYCLFFLAFFYLKLHYHFQENMLTWEDWAKILEAQKHDKKVRQKEENQINIYGSLITQKQVRSRLQPKRESSRKRIEGQILSFKMLDRLKIFKRQNEMIFGFSTHFFPFTNDYKEQKDVLEFFETITKLQPTNYEDNIRAKLTRIWDKLPDAEKYLKQSITIVIQKIFILHLKICTKIFLQTGIY